MKQLILGGARSGKSSLAEQLAINTGKKLVYVATADKQHNDEEMNIRIAHHKNSRSELWSTLETPKRLADDLSKACDNDTCILVDCLTLWLSNCLLDSDQNCWSEQKQAFYQCLEQLPGDIIMVGNEVGSGIVPMGEINRRFVDENGFLHQQLAKMCDRVILTAAGLPMVLKGEPL